MFPFQFFYDKSRVTDVCFQFQKAAIGRKLEDIFEKEPNIKVEILRYIKDSLMPLVPKFVPWFCP